MSNAHGLRALRRALLLVCGLFGVVGGLAQSTGTAHAAPRTPVIIIPGVAGSTFDTVGGYTFTEGNNGHGGSYQHSYGSNENVWVNVWEAALPGDDDYFDTLRLNPDAITPAVPYSNLRVSGIYSSAYSDLIDYLHRQGYSDNVNLFVYAYDWRRDIPTATFANLDALINQARAAAGTTQVDLIGHSMGGLVARSYVNTNAASAAKIRRVINFGSPYLGSPKFLKALLYGDQFGPTFLGLGLSPDEVRDIVQDMSGGWELLPSRAYFNFYDNGSNARLSPYREDRDVDGDGVARGALNYGGLQTFLRNLGKNQNAAAFGQNFHDNLDTRWPAGVRVSFIDGSGLATLGQIRDYVGTCSIFFYHYACNQRDELTVDGDGTVPYYSASLRDPARNLNLAGGAALHVVNREHGALVQYDHNFVGGYSGDGNALPLLGQILNNTLDPLGAAPQATPDVVRPHLGGYWIAATNGVQLDVYDAANNHTGRIAGKAHGQEQRIANSIADTLDRTQFVYVPAGGSYSLRLTATAPGSFDLRIRELDGESVRRSLTWLNVAASTGDSLSFDLHDFGTTRPALSRNGGGKITATGPLTAAQSADSAAPMIKVAAPKVSGNTAVVRWTAHDTLTGLALQEAVLDPGTTDARLVRNGQRLRLASGTHTLQVLAQDRAGNTAATQVAFVVK